jgi:hypothetical protein
MRALAFVILAACQTTGPSTVTHGALESTAISGSGTVTIPGLGVTLLPSHFDFDGSPAVTGDASFIFELADASNRTRALIECDPLPWASVSLGEVTPMASLVGAECNVLVSAPDCVRSYAVTTGTIAVQAALDGDGNGTLALELADVSDGVAADGHGTCAAELAVHVDVDVIGTAVFHDFETP